MPRTRRRAAAGADRRRGCRRRGRIGFEIFDRTAFGTTEFLEHVNYRRALEGEIARTIATHLAKSPAPASTSRWRKDSLFGRQRAAGQGLGRAEAEGQPRRCRPPPSPGIANLVAASVEGLRPESVVILDSFGRPLATPPTADGRRAGSRPQIERQQRLEQRPVDARRRAARAGRRPGRVRVNVAARLNPAVEEQTEEHWDPATVVRSQQTPTDDVDANAGGIGGVAGARAQPAAGAARRRRAGATPPRHAGRAAGRDRPRAPSKTTNYEVSRTTRHTIQPRGDVARLSVAVILDDDARAARRTRTASRRSKRSRARAAGTAEAPGTRRRRGRPRRRPAAISSRSRTSRSTSRCRPSAAKRSATSWRAPGGVADGARAGARPSAGPIIVVGLRPEARCRRALRRCAQAAGGGRSRRAPTLPAGSRAARRSRRSKARSKRSSTPRRAGRTTAGCRC